MTSLVLKIPERLSEVPDRDIYTARVEWHLTSSMRDLEGLAISMRYEERVIGCFKGLAIGDAIGKQTETLTRTDVQKWYPLGITGFHGLPGDVIPRYAGKRYEWRIGETTDDTEQTLAVARALLREGDVSHAAIGRELLKCKKSLHPGVSMWTFVQIGDPARVASEGDGCGAAMRTAPVGVIYPSSRLDDLTRGAYESLPLLMADIWLFARLLQWLVLSQRHWKADQASKC